MPGEELIKLAVEESFADLVDTMERLADNYRAIGGPRPSGVKFSLWVQGHRALVPRCSACSLPSFIATVILKTALVTAARSAIHTHAESRAKRMLRPRMSYPRMGGTAADREAAAIPGRAGSFRDVLDQRGWEVEYGRCTARQLRSRIKIDRQP